MGPANAEFDEAWYLTANPDVRAAVEKGFFSSGLDHYNKHGRAEGRAPRSSYVQSDELAYLKDEDGPSTIPAREIEKTVTTKGVCDFYHVTDLPDGTVTRGQWDLRAGFDAYVGNVAVRGKSVLEIGPASGFLSFEMERRGARVTAIEPPITQLWDYVPRPNAHARAFEESFPKHIEKVRNSFWFLHGLKHSGVKLFEADAYNLPKSLGRFDIGLFGSVLLHCSSPVEMMASAARRVDHTVIVCEILRPDLVGQPVCRLIPSQFNNIMDTWWEFSPEFFTAYLGALGFCKSSVSRHKQLITQDSAGRPVNTPIEMFTVVASRS